jgi:FtsH-binding integral membrane protein
MVCPTCILPFLSMGATLASGSAAYKAKTKSLMILMIVASLIFTGITIYIFIKKDDLKQNCESCKMPEDQNKK